ncbi:hypothetical protein M405DRAFT_150790 [Rhizopogon salebrosus TDB-379]|nr:hypothetical protein M405DRAFT_150790 [Rhizopogon salebrosus TDB-379]
MAALPAFRNPHCESACRFPSFSRPRIRRLIRSITDIVSQVICLVFPVEARPSLQSTFQVKTDRSIYSKSIPSWLLP